MPLSLREVLQIGVLKRAVLVCGGRGLDRPVEWVEVLETPDGARWTRPRSLVLTTFYSVRDDPGAQRRAVDELIGAGASGLVVALRPGVKPAMEVWLEAAEAEAFPVMYLPPDVAYWQVSVPVIEAIMERGRRTIQSGGADTILTGDLLGANRGLRDVAQQLSLLLDGRPVGIVPVTEGLPVFSAPVEADVQERVRSVILATLGSQLQERLLLTCEDAGPWSEFVAYPVLLGRQVLGFLVLGFRDPPAGRDQVAVEHGLAAVTLGLANRRVAREATWHMANDLLARLLASELPECSALERDAAALGWSLQGRRVAVVVEVGLHGTPQLAERIGMLRSAADALSEGLQATTAERGVPLGSFEGRIVGFPLVTSPAQSGGGGGRKRAAEQAIGLLVADVLGSALHVSFGCGLGTSAEGIRGLRDSYRKARIALDIGHKVHPQRQVYSWDEVEFFYMASLVAKRPEARDLYLRVIKPLLDYDGRHQGELLQTLEALIWAGCNQNVVARQMFAHRGTIKYRLERMVQILGFDPTSPPMVPKVAMALAFWRLGLDSFDQTAEA